MRPKVISNDKRDEYSVKIKNKRRETGLQSGKFSVLLTNYPVEYPIFEKSDLNVIKYLNEGNYETGIVSFFNYI